MVVKSVGVFSVGRVLACLYGLIGLIVGASFSLVSLAGVAVGGPDSGPVALLFGVGAIVVLPLFYGVMGFVGGIIIAALYNIVSSFAGGIEIELTK